MSRPQFVLVAGPNGAGKSTLTQSIKHRFPNIEVIDPDAIAKSITGSFITIDQEQLAAGKKTLALIKKHIDNQQSLMVESTISGSTYLKYAQMANVAGFRTVFIYVSLRSAEMSAERVAKRVAMGGHSIPFEDVKRRYPRSMGNLKVFIKEFESAHIYDNSDHYKWIAAFRNGLLHKATPDIPSWLTPYIFEKIVRIKIIAVGTKMPDWVEQGYADYAKRLPRDLTVELVELPLAIRTKNTDIARAIEKEGEAILGSITKGDQVIALDVKGKSWSTEELAQQLATWKMSGFNYCLLIGGPDGLAPSCLSLAKLKWSLSSLTLPHPLVRILLIEQLYRASSILQNHPYHK